MERRAYNKFECLVIDEVKLLFDYSDHCMIRVDFKLIKRKNNKIVNCEYIEYYSIGEENKVGFVEKAVTLQGGVDCMKVFHGVVVENADWILKRE